MSSRTLPSSTYFDIAKRRRTVRPLYVVTGCNMLPTAARRGQTQTDGGTPW